MPKVRNWLMFFSGWGMFFATIEVHYLRPGDLGGIGVCIVSGLVLLYEAY